MGKLSWTFKATPHRLFLSTPNNTILQKRFFPVLLLICITLLSYSQIVRAEHILYPEVQYTFGGSIGTSNTLRSSVAYNRNLNEYMVISGWELLTNGNNNISAKRVSPNGQGTSLGILSTSTMCESPDIAFDFYHNRYLVVWSQYYSLGSRWEIWGRIINADSLGNGTPFMITTSPGYDLKFPKVAFGYNIGSNKYEYMVVYQTAATDSGALYGLNGIAVKNDGTFPIPPFQIDAGPNIGNPDITFNPGTAEFLAVWAEYNGTNGIIDINGRRVGLDGPLASSFSVSPAVENQQQPVVTSNSQNRYLVLWQYDFQGDGTDWDIRGRFLDVTGTGVGSEFGIAYSFNSERNISVASNPLADDYLVVWQKDDAVFGNTIRARQFTTSRVFKDDFEVAPAAGGSNSYPTVGGKKSGYFIAYIWDDFVPTKHGDLYGKFFQSKFPWVLFQHLFKL